MLALIAILFLCALPLLSYLLHPLSTQKPLIFLAAIFLYGGLFLNHISSKPLLGQWSYAQQADSITQIIKENRQVPDSMLDNFLSQMNDSEDSFLLGVEIFYKSLDMKSFASAESILGALNSTFQSQNFKVPIYNLLADLRDLQYPLIAEANLSLEIEGPVSCKINKLTVIANIPNGPDVNIAVKNFLLPDLSKVLFVDKSDALVRGFDLPSAFLYQEIIQIEVLGFCEKTTFYAVKTLDLGYSTNNKDKIFIYANEWLKKEQ